MLLKILIEIILLPFLITSYFLYKYTHSIGNIGKDTGMLDEHFSMFQHNYFCPYFMALFSDWLQGPYVYQLYSSYGFTQSQIAILFLIGFSSSVTIGTATGPLADKFGRKKFILLFCIIYSISCTTKVSSNFNILAIGRVLGGVATSVLFSVFESWYIFQHTVVKNYPNEWISTTFSKATFFNGLLAIIAGFIGDIAVDRLNLGPVSPFIIAIPFLVFGFIWVYTKWDENYGLQKHSWNTSCWDGLQTILHNSNILVLGLLQSIFEANMYIFVFLWTPVLKFGEPPLGLTFSCFMIAIMFGSSIYSILMNRFGLNSEKILSLCLSLMTISMLTCSILTNPTLDTHPQLKYTNSTQEVSHTILIQDNLTFDTEFRMISIFLSFILLEITVGIYFPSIGYLRSEIIPEGLRANIMNWFRVPLNIITCAALLGIRSSNSPRVHQTVFLFCGISSLIGYILSRKLQSSKSQLKFKHKLQPDTLNENFTKIRKEVSTF